MISLRPFGMPSKLCLQAALLPFLVPVTSCGSSPMVAKPPGIAATLYVSRNNKLLLSGFFSAKLRGRQVSWLPCEIEALSIVAATKHFFFSELIGTKHLFVMLLEWPSYRLTLVVAIPLNMTVQLAKYAPLLKAQRIPWYFSPPCKVYSPVQLSSLSLAGPLNWPFSLSAPT